MNRRAFTLIEILVSLALSLMVILAVYAGIRTAVRSITAVERLSLENAILVIALQTAVERADAWTDLDDPTNPAKQPLRVSAQADYSYQGNYYDDVVGKEGTNASRWPQPFTPIMDQGGISGSWQFSGSSVAFDPDGWLPHRIASWYRGDHAHYDQDDEGSEEGKACESIYGNYGLFAAIGDPADVDGSGGIEVGAVQSSAVRRTLPAWRQWAPGQHHIMRYGLGWHGWFDYLPANAPLDYYAVTPMVRPVEDRMKSVKPREIRRHVSGYRYRSDAFDGTDVLAWLGVRHGTFHKQNSSNLVWHGVASDGSEVWAFGRPSRYHTSVGQAATKGWLWDVEVGISGEHPIVNRSMVGPYYSADSAKGGDYSHSFETLSTLPALLTILGDDWSLIATPPADWPRLTVDLRRFMTWGTPRTHGYIRFTDPISGESRELFFPVTGTTLRGARLSRGLDATP